MGKDINMKGQEKAPGRDLMTPSSTWSSGTQTPESREQVWNRRQPVIPDQPQRDAPLISAPPPCLIALAFEFNPSFLS